MSLCVVVNRNGDGRLDVGRVGDRDLAVLDLLEESVVLVNGESLTNGGTATWEDDDTEVLVTVSDSKGSTTYKVTVTKS